jgi:hypothetical protein
MTPTVLLSLIWASDRLMFSERAKSAAIGETKSSFNVSKPIRWVGGDVDHFGNVAADNFPDSDHNGRAEHKGGPWKSGHPRVRYWCPDASTLSEVEACTQYNTYMYNAIQHKGFPLVSHGYLSRACVVSGGGSAAGEARRRARVGVGYCQEVCACAGVGRASWQALALFKAFVSRVSTNMFEQLKTYSTSVSSLQQGLIVRLHDSS